MRGPTAEAKELRRKYEEEVDRRLGGIGHPQADWNQIADLVKEAAAATVGNRAAGNPPAWTTLAALALS